MKPLFGLGRCHPLRQQIGCCVSVPFNVSFATKGDYSAAGATFGPARLGLNPAPALRNTELQAWVYLEEGFGI